MLRKFLTANWFDLPLMEERIAKDEVSEQEALNYYLGIIVLILLFQWRIFYHRNYSADYVNSPQTATDLWETMIKTTLFALSQVIGLLAAFRVNYGYDNKHFFKRWLPLVFINGSRLFVIIFIGGALVIRFVKSQASDQAAEVVQHIGGYLSVLFCVLLYYTVYLSFKRVVSKMEEMDIEKEN